MVSIRIIVKRFLRRVRYAFLWKEIINWEFESCERCGHCFKICWSAKDKVWEAVYGDDSGCLCIDCFVELAQERGVKIDHDSIERMELFLGDMD